MEKESGEGVEKRAWWTMGMAGVWAIALGTVVVHAATGWRYGFNRDELMALEDARHLAWGYVQYPPMTAFFGWIALKLFGTSLVGFRFFAAVAQALALVLTGVMAKEMARAVASGEWRVASKTQEPGSQDEPGAPARRTENGKWKIENGEDEIRNSKFEIRYERRGDWAAVVAAGAGVPFCLGGGALMQYISFDYVCWVLVVYGMVRALGCKGYKGASEQVSGSVGGNDKLADRRVCATWWAVVGMGIGLGMMAKYTMGLLVAGVVVGVLATEARKFLRSGWLWLGALVSVAIWAPNVWWQWQRGFPSLEFLRFLHTRDVSTGVTDGFLVGQLELTLLAFPLAVAGLWFYLFTKEGKPYRAIGWMYLVPLVLLVAIRGRDYYLAPAYPMLYAAGAVLLEVKSGSKEVGKQGKERNSKLESRNSTNADENSVVVAWLREEKSERAEKWNSRTVKAGRWMKRWVPAMLVMDAVVAGCVALPIMPVNSRWWQMAAQVDTVLPEELGWEELTETVAHIRDGLPEKDQARLGILARNYGEMGALNLYGEKYGLPRAISGVNSSWERGYGNPAPETVIAVGYSRDFLEGHFASCELAGHPWNRYGVENEERIEDPDVFVCRGLKESWDEFWKKVKLFA